MEENSVAELKWKKQCILKYTKYYCIEFSPVKMLG